MIKKNIIKLKEELDKIDKMIYNKQNLCKEDYKMLEKFKDDVNSVLYSIKIYFINRGDYKYNG